MAGRSTFISVGRIGRLRDPGAVCRECQRQTRLQLSGVLDAGISVAPNGGLRRPDGKETWESKRVVPYEFARRVGGACSTEVSLLGRTVTPDAALVLWDPVLTSGSGRRVAQESVTSRELIQVDLPCRKSIHHALCVVGT